MYWTFKTLRALKLIYLNYQVIKILENCFQNMKYFPWIKLISVMIHLKYWYCNTPSLQLPCLPRHLCQISPWPTEIPLQRNPLHVLHYFPYFFLPHSTTRHNYWIYQTICQTKPIKFIIKLYTNTRYLSRSWAFKSRFYFKVRQDSPQQLYLQYKVSWILYKIVGAFSFSQTYLCLQPKIRSATSVILHHRTLPLLFHKVIFTIPTNTTFLYTSAIFQLPIFACSQPYNLRQNYFSYLSLLSQSIDRDSRAHNHWFLIASCLW